MCVCWCECVLSVYLLDVSLNFRHSDALINCYWRREKLLGFCLRLLQQKSQEQFFTKIW